MRGVPSARCLVTNGMSEHVQHGGDGQHVRCELWMGVERPRQRWPMRLLDGLTRYPFVNQTYFAPYDLVPLAAVARLARGPRPYVMLLPDDDDGEHHHEATTALYQVVGVESEEHEFAQDQGGAALAARLREVPEAYWIDGSRGRVV